MERDSDVVVTQLTKLTPVIASGNATRRDYKRYKTLQLASTRQQNLAVGATLGEPLMMAARRQFCAWLGLQMRKPDGRPVTRTTATSPTAVAAVQSRPRSGRAPRSRSRHTSRPARSSGDDRPRPAEPDDPFRVCRKCDRWGFADLDFEPGRRVCRACRTAVDLDRYHRQKAAA